MQTFKVGDKVSYNGIIATICYIDSINILLGSNSQFGWTAEMVKAHKEEKSYKYFFEKRFVYGYFVHSGDIEKYLLVTFKLM
jgi:hypothetical protein